MIARINKMAIQVPLSPDAAYAAWALLGFGECVFPGISKAELVVWDGDSSPDGRSAQELEADGILAVNCGGGRLDHHPHYEKPDDCAFTLTLKTLSLNDDPRFRELKEYALWDDIRPPKVQGNGAPLAGSVLAHTWARSLKDMQTNALLTAGSDPESRLAAVQPALEWLFTALDHKYRTQDRLFTEGAAAFALASKSNMTGASGNRYRIATAETDCPEFTRYVRSSYGNKASVVIQMRGTGNVQIMTDGRLKLDVGSLADRVREEEILHSGLVVDEDVDLAVEGKAKGVPHWYFLKQKSPDGASMLLNGSDRHRDVPPTKIHLGRLVNLTREWLETQ